MPSQPSPARRNALRVLHLEDSELDHELEMAHLRRGGALVETLRVDSEPAFRAALEGQWDIVLSDFNVPGFSGLAALDIVKSLDHPLPFILVSGEIGEDVAVAAMRNGASDYLLKANLARLAPAVEHAIDAHDARRARERADHQLAQSRKRLSELAQHLQTSVDNERAAIAREIHDDVGGSLTALKFDIAWIARHSKDALVTQRAQSRARSGHPRHRVQQADHAQPAPGDPGAGPGSRAAVDGQPLREAHRRRVQLPHQPRDDAAAVGALQRSDLLITLGARFDDRVTGKLSSFAPDAKVIHADIDPAEISKNRAADVPIVGDCREVIADLVVALQAELAAGRSFDYAAWWSQLSHLVTTYPLGYEIPADGSLAPQYVIERLGAIVGPDAIYAAGVGQHQMWAAQFVHYEKPNTWLNSGGAGTMGYAVPAAMGAKVGCPDTTVWAIDGDGCFQMTNQELATCALNDIPIKVAIINNGSLGMVRQWQTLFYESRYSNTTLHSKRIPDFPKLAEAYGCVGLRCDKAEDVDRTIAEAMEIDDRPVVVDFGVHQDAMVWPMVAAGTSNDEIMVARDLAPSWDRED